MVPRRRELAILKKLLRRYAVVGIVGARQVGKTTLARALLAQQRGPFADFDLENPEDLARLGDPMLALKDLKGLVVLDEIQRQPDLLAVLRVLADRPRRPARFLVLGSAAPALLRQNAETLAGRIAYHELHGLALDEVGVKNHARLWLRGGFPPSYLAATNAQSHEWRQNFIRTFLERDLPQLGINLNAATLRRFWTMLPIITGKPGIRPSSRAPSGGGYDHPPLPGCPDLGPGGPAASALVRQRRQAAGEGPQGICSR